ncbi:hypothetical protein GQX74_013132 [Glossina fuscipes]|nr:hypothetical protein GQX74_013132 [Glossina fuscipes]
MRCYFILLIQIILFSSAATFTYICSIQALRIRSYPVKQEKDFLNDTTDYFEQLVHTLYDAFDRMVMQSDFRDVCNGIQLANFSVNKIPENKETTLAYDNLTLSKNSNEKRLQEVFKKQLRLSNYSIGGTDLYISGADSLIIMVLDIIRGYEDGENALDKAKDFNPPPTTLSSIITRDKNNIREAGKYVTAY